MEVTTTGGSAEGGKKQSALKKTAVATITKRRCGRGRGGGDDKMTDNNDDHDNHDDHDDHDNHDDHDDHDTTIKQRMEERGRRKMVVRMNDGRQRNWRVPEEQSSKEEGGGTQDYSTLDNYTMDDNNNDKITLQSNSSREME
jgi:ABC-type Zn2+ transport system substrate-binding protein/surface adhesin